MRVSIWWVIGAFIAGTLLSVAASTPGLSRWWFIGFFYVGTIVGIFVFGLCKISGEADDQAELANIRLKDSVIATNA